MPATPLSALLGELRQQETTIRQGGGASAIQRQHEKGRLTARERIAKLTDDFFELGLWAAWQMYADWGGASPPRRRHWHRHRRGPTELCSSPTMPP